MNNRSFLSMSIVCTVVLTLTLALAAPVGGVSDRFSGPFLSPPKKGDKPWCHRLFYFTDWPETKNPPEVRDNVYSPYSYEKLIENVIGDKVLATGWEKQTVHAKDWIPILPGMISSRLDAYVYRQTWRDYVLHICDTRPILVVALLSRNANDPDANAIDTVLGLARELFRTETPSSWNWKMTFREASGFSMVYGPVGLPSATNSSNSGTTQVSGISRPGASFGVLNCVFGKGVVIYEFQKSSFQGYDLSADVPLFRLASEKGTTLEEALDFFEGLKVVSPTNIPDMVQRLASLPVMKPEHGRLATYEFKLLLRAKYLGYDKLEAAMEAIPTSEEGIALVKEALSALPREDDLRGRAENMEKVALRKLQTIKKPSALEELRRIARTTKKPRIAEEALEYCIEAHPRKQVREYSIGELEKLADTPDSYPIETVMFIKGLGEKTDAKDRDLLRRILEKTREVTVRDECLRRLEEIKHQGAGPQ